MKKWFDLLLIAGVLGLIGIGLWQIMATDDNAVVRVSNRQKAAKKPKSPSVERELEEIQDTKPESIAAAPVPTDVPKVVPTEEEIVWSQVTTNASGIVTEKFTTADGKKHRVIHHPKRTFTNASDQLIAMAISASKSGGTMPPLPLTDATEKDFLESLETPIVIEEDDSEEIKELKRDVATVREELIGLVKSGMTVREALEQHQEQVNANASYREEALDIFNQLKGEGDEQGAEEFRIRINSELEGRGITPLKGRKGTAP